MSELNRLSQGTVPAGQPTFYPWSQSNIKTGEMVIYPKDQILEIINYISLRLRYLEEQKQMFQNDKDQIIFLQLEDHIKDLQIIFDHFGGDKYVR